MGPAAIIAMEKLSDPAVQKKIATGIVLIIVVIIIWAQWKNIKLWFKKTKSDTEVKSEAYDLETQAAASGEIASYGDAQYTSYARQLETLMTGNTTTAERQQIINIIGMMNNNVDWAKLIKSFGVRTFKSGTLTGKSTLDLIGWLNKELNNNEIQSINNYFEQIGILARI